MQIPSEAECYRYIAEMKMLDHIVDHSVQVCRVAVFMAAHMSGDGLRLDSGLIRAAALLHDITKTRSFETRENHAETGARFLYERGYRDVGRIVEQHVRLETYFASTRPDEAEIINYADKRVLHDQVVSLRQRMTYILKKYGQTPEHRERLQWLWGKTKELERRLFDYLPFPPDELGNRMAAENRQEELVKRR